MMNCRKNVCRPALGIVAIGSLVACSGSGGSSGSGVGPSPEVSSLTGSPATEYEFDADNNRVLLGNPVATQVAAEEATIEVTVPENFNAYQGTERDIFAFRGVTPSGNGVTTIYAAGADAASLTGAFAERAGPETVVPDTGIVNYDGQYAGVIRSLEGDSVSHAVSGTATMTASFADGQVSGVISDRVATLLSLTTIQTDLADIELQTTSIENGGFAGTTTGGGFPTVLGFEFDTDQGNYSGLFVGADGEEIVGNLDITHTRVSDDARIRQEVGAFILE